MNTPEECRIVAPVLHRPISMDEEIIEINTDLQNSEDINEKSPGPTATTGRIRRPPNHLRDYDLSHIRLSSPLNKVSQSEK